MAYEDVATDWTIEHARQYTPADRDREMAYVTYRHDAGDLRLRVAPASIDCGDQPGYAITTTAYPGLDFVEHETIRSVLRFERANELAQRFMSLFGARYDGPETFEEALEYATVRVRASSAHDAPADVALSVPETDDNE
ncbi:hypothetical protein [Natronosalvus vescus]|uniref:hypothetical protein n=1 Tax=Natronosalvus vescus TaxID=2953881 RepID=UPI002090173C|nr:hypothetical protein [Natronosalvus vescus]